MIITKKVRIKESSKYKKLNYKKDIDGFIEINIEELSTTSHVEILAKCDFCGNEKKLKYRTYIENISRKNKFSCSKKCGKNKSKETNLERYGVENPIQNKDIQNKTKLTNLERYGTEYTFQNDNVKEKSKKTNLERYGTEFVLQNEDILNKVKQTNLEKYGVENIFQNDEIKEKSKKTNLEKYGVEYVLQNTNILNKLKKTNLEKYGTEYVLQNENIFNKVKQTNLEKYGVDNYNKSEESRKEFTIANHLNYIKYLDNRVSLFKCDCDKEHEFEIHKDNFYKRIESNLPLCTICYPIGDNKSIKEKILLEYIQSIYSGEIISGYRDELEIDIYLPDLKIGIEFNGLYWHSNKFKEVNYHINKLNWFKKKGIDIKFIYEDDFDNNLDIIKSQINNWLGLTFKKIYARKCEIKEVNTEEYKIFLNNNHIQGYVASKIVYGLYHQNNLVSLMCFDKKEGRLNMLDSEWNLNRFCNLLNHQIIGGASKLLNHFIKNNNPSRIISYADKDWSNGNLYFVLGFTLINESKPDYKYIIDGIRKSKQNFTKAKLGKMGHDISLTESKIMNNLGINKIYDCGKMKFEKIIKLNDFMTNKMS